MSKLSIKILKLLKKFKNNFDFNNTLQLLESFNKNTFKLFFKNTKYFYH